MKHPKLKKIIQTSIISAFTIATALIWKDVIIDTIRLLVPTGEKQLFYEYLVAIAATITLIIVLYTVLTTEEKAEQLMNRITKKRKK